MNTKIIVLAVVMLALSACATTPKQQEIVQTAPSAEVPAPVIVEPEPVVPMEPAPVEEAAPLIPQGPQPGTADHFKYMSGEDRVYFGYNEFSLTPQTREVLKSQASWLQQYNRAIIVIGGNADERGTREYNLALGARRADAVKAFLVSQGVAPGRITTVSYGKERPIDGRSNEAAWALNRNAHSVVLVGGSS
ncbi:MAG: peptidoglycan-associated lipoprotein Pal [Robiginitomaculum sp.]|nr:peptidoglycan-associated lipoprotein Pal [Robiginitomaculum sp.]